MCSKESVPTSQWVRPFFFLRESEGTVLSGGNKLTSMTLEPMAL